MKKINKSSKMMKKTTITEYAVKEPKRKLIPEIEMENVKSETFNSPPPEIIQTLPDSFKSLAENPIKIERKQPRYIIELLGNLLGVTDYKTNMASYWFLDTIGLQVLRHETQLDDLHRSILVSWLAGELKMIQERRFYREDFFKEMAVVFCKTSENLSLGYPLPYWDRIVTCNSEDDLEKKVEEEITSAKLKNEEKARQEANVSEISDLSANFEKVLDQSAVSEARNVLDTIVEATYDMFGNAFYYAIVRAAFVDPIQVHSYALPYVLRKLRPVKNAEFDERAVTTLNVKAGKGRREKAVTKEKKNGRKKAMDRSFDEQRRDSDSFVEAPAPPPSLSDDESLLRKREFILPLIEANEASDIFRMYDETTSA